MSKVDPSETLLKALPPHAQNLDIVYPVGGTQSGTAAVASAMTTATAHSETAAATAQSAASAQGLGQAPQVV